MLRSILSWFMAVGQGHGHGCDFIMEFPWVTLNYGNPLSRKHSRVDYGFKSGRNSEIVITQVNKKKLCLKAVLR